MCMGRPNLLYYGLYKAQILSDFALSIGVENDAIEEDNAFSLQPPGRHNMLTTMQRLKTRGQSISEIQAENLSTICFVNRCGE